LLLGAIAAGVTAAVVVYVITDSAEPQKLDGAWNRNVSDGSVLGTDHTGLWSLRFGANDIVVIYEPVGAHVAGVRDTFSVTYSATPGGRLVMGAGPGCATEGIYRWRLTGDVLRISQVTDACPRRIAVIPGNWSRLGAIRGIPRPHP
jgi:hypothetical protein